MENVPGFTLRVMTRSDLVAVARLEEELFAPSGWSYEVLDDELHTSGRFYIVAEQESVGPIGIDSVPRVRGYGGIAVGEMSEIMTVGVSETVRGQGMGRAIMKKLLAHADASPTEAIFLEVATTNTIAKNLYESLGFITTRVRKGYYQPENLDAIEMRRDKQA